MYTIKQLLSLCFVTATISIGLGFLLGAGINKNSVVNDPMNNNGKMAMQKNGDNTFEAGWKAAEERLKQSNMIPPADIEIKEVQGEVLSINAQNIKIKINPLTPLADSSLDEREIIINDQTIIYKLTQKDQQIFEAEMKVYNEKVEALMNSENFNPESLGESPNFFNKEKVDLSILKEKQILRVTTEEDIKDKKSFVAKEILFDEMMNDIINNPDQINEVSPSEAVEEITE